MIETLTDYQRLNLLNQYKTLYDLAQIRDCKEDIEKYQEYIDIVTNGFVGKYDQLTNELLDEFPKEESRFVLNTLDMYSVIYYSYGKIETPKISQDKIRFDGFDGTEELYYLNYCMHVLFDKSNRFGALTEGGKRKDFNSHCNRCNRYHKMLDQWERMGKPYVLKESDIGILISIY